MLRLSLVACAFLSTSSLFAVPGIPDGRYEGKGTFKSESGLVGEYESILVVDKNTLSATYKFPVNFEETYTSTLNFKDDHFFAVIGDNDESIGRGYCTGELCHIDMTSMAAEETLSYKDGMLKRWGSKKNQMGSIFYTESLAPVSNP